MSLLTSVVLGLVAGFLGSKLINKSGEGFILDIVLGIVGAIVGGFLFNMFGARGVTGLNLYSLFVAVIGSIVFLVVFGGNGAGAILVKALRLRSSSRRYSRSLMSHCRGFSLHNLATCDLNSRART